MHREAASAAAGTGNKALRGKMNRNRRSSKRKIIVASISALFAILLFWLVLHLVVDRGLLDEQFGDSGEWGDEEDEQITLLFGDAQDEVYVSDDKIDTYLIIGTDAGNRADTGSKSGSYDGHQVHHSSWIHRLRS